MRRYLLFALALPVICYAFHASRAVDVESHAELMARLRSLGAFEDELEGAITDARSKASPRDCHSRLDALTRELARLLHARNGSIVVGGGAVLAELERYRANLEAIRPVLDEISTAQQRMRAAQQVLEERGQRMVDDSAVGPDPLSRAIIASISGVFRAAGTLDAEALEATARELARWGEVALSERELVAPIVIALEDLSKAERAFEAARRGVDLTRLRASRLCSIEELEQALVVEQEGREVYRLAVCALVLLLLGLILHQLRARDALLEQVEQVREALEARFRRRTAQLSRKNEQLAQEIHERRQAELQLATARGAAESASRSKSEFLANMSHEIRTPMTAILGYAERLGDDDLGEHERREAVDSIQRNGQYLLQIINDILDLSKIEAGKLVLERIPCSPVQIVLDVQKSIEVRAQAKGIDFVIELPASMPETILTDPTRLKQVLINLLGNAIKFTERGSVTLRVDPGSAGSDGDGSFLAFEVEDTGIGMDSAQVERLFRPFTQAESSTTRKFGGTGLGLSICKTLVECMGGAMRVESRPGEGSSFHFRIDTGGLQGVRWIDGEGIAQLRLGFEAERLRETGVRIQGRVLLAEDGPDNQRLLTHFLTKAGAEVEAAADGHKAVERALAAQASGHPFDLVVMDMQMPRLDGYGATSRLRAAGYRRPIIALTANAMAHDRKRCLDAGCDDFCSKPVDKYRFLSIVARWISVVPCSSVQARDESHALMRTTFRTLATVSKRWVDPPPALPRRQAETPSSDPGPAAASRRASPGRVEPAAPTSMPSGRTGSSIDEDDPELKELVALFLADLSCDLDRLTQALEKNDLASVAFLAHQLKGSSGSYGFPELSQQAARLELCAKGELTGSHVEIELEEFARLCHGVQSQRR